MCHLASFQKRRGHSLKAYALFRGMWRGTEVTALSSCPPPPTSPESSDPLMAEIKSGLHHSWCTSFLRSVLIPNQNSLCGGRGWNLGAIFLRCHQPLTPLLSFFFLAMFSLELSNAWCLVLELILGDCSCTHSRSLPSLSQVSLVHVPMGSWNGDSSEEVESWAVYSIRLLSVLFPKPGSR